MFIQNANLIMLNNNNTTQNDINKIVNMDILTQGWRITYKLKFIIIGTMQIYNNTIMGH